jgi:Mannitol repressor
MTKNASRASLNNAIQTLRKRIAERPESAVLWRTLLDVAEQRNDRTCALVLGAIAEQAIEEALLTHFVSIDPASFFGPPQESPITFDVKIRLAYALGIIGQDSRDDLTCVRHIRNVFAHTKTDITFKSPDIITICNEFKFINKVPWEGIYGTRPDDAIDKYYYAVRHYFLYLALPSDDGKPLLYSSITDPSFYL